MKFLIFALILACAGFLCAFALFRTKLTTALQIPIYLEVKSELPGIVLQTAPAQGANPSKPVDTDSMIRAAAQKHRVPAAFVKSIVAAESNFRCDAVSPKGAIGLMQLMPGTAMQYGADPTIPEQNIDAGTRYLRVLMDRYSKHRNSLKRVIAAYNAGPRTVDRYRGIPPFRETRGYVTRVLGYLRRFEKEQG